MSTPSPPKRYLWGGRPAEAAGGAAPPDGPVTVVAGTTVAHARPRGVALSNASLPLTRRASMATEASKCSLTRYEHYVTAADSIAR